MDLQRNAFKWFVLAIVLALLLSWVLITPSVAAQGKLPLDGTLPPTLIPNTPTPRVESIPAPLGIQSMGESTTLTTSDWSSPLNISDTNFNSLVPHMAADSNGGVHIVWVEKGSGGNGVIYYRYKEGMGWSDSINISNNIALNANDPDIVLDNTGKAHIVWAANNSTNAEIYYSQCTGTNCTTPVILSGYPNRSCSGYPAQNWWSGVPVIGIDAGERLMVQWQAYEPGGATMPYSTWLASETPPSSSIGCIPSGPGVTIR